MRAERQLQGREQRDADRLQQMQEALRALQWQIANLEDRLSLIATQLTAAELVTAESCLRGEHGPRQVRETSHLSMAGAAV